LVGIFFIMLITGMCIFGTFSFSGELLRIRTDWNILLIGLSLSLFGIGGMIGSRLVPFIRKKYQEKISVIAGITGFICLGGLFLLRTPYGMFPAFFFLGVAFIFLHSTMLLEAQNSFPELKGSIMSFASFSVFTGSAAGTVIYKQIIGISTIEYIFTVAAFLFLLNGIIAYYIVKKTNSPHFIHSSRASG
jgi:predicted MFS family arabinose efflux permease